MPEDKKSMQKFHKPLGPKERFGTQERADEINRGGVTLTTLMRSRPKSEELQKVSSEKSKNTNI